MLIKQVTMAYGGFIVINFPTKPLSAQRKILQAALSLPGSNLLNIGGLSTIIKHLNKLRQ